MKNHELFKKYFDFSLSGTHSCSSLFIGPIFLLLSFLIGLAFGGHLFLPIIAAIGLALISFLSAVGFSIAMLLFFLYFGVGFLFSFKEMTLWDVTWGMSLTCGLLISFLSLQELQFTFKKENKEKEGDIESLKNDLERVEKKNRSEKSLLESELTKANDELLSLKEEIPLLMNLVEASEIEAEKSFNQNQTLSKKSLEECRAIASLENLLNEKQGDLKKLRKENKELLKKSQDTLESLNTFRLELYQAELLLKGVNKKGSPCQQQELDLGTTLITPEKKQLKEPEKETSNDLLKKLENKKMELKKSYALNMQEIKEVKEDLERLRQKGEEDFSQTHKTLFDKKKKEIEEVRLELTSIERKIFITKKEMQQQGVSIYSS